VELNTNAMDDPCVIIPANFTCASDDPTALNAGLLELWDGDADAEYSDDSTVLLERIVGDISLRGRTIPDPAEGTWQLPYCRMGILAVEEVETITDKGVNLWNREVLEEYQWLWLWQTCWPELSFSRPPTTSEHLYYGDAVHVDCRVRRKLGKKDHLVMLSQLAVVGGFAGSVVSVEYVHDLRGVFTVR